MALNLRQEQLRQPQPAPLQAAPTPQPQAPSLGQQAAGAGKEFATQAGGKAIGAALTPVLGPLGPIAGPLIADLGMDAISSLFNVGGKVPMQGLNNGGPARETTEELMKRLGTTAMNTGGTVRPPLANPNGYNEGGSVTETPIKKVMDEQKLEQQALAFDIYQLRMSDAHNMAMKQKQQQFAEAQKMKKAAATTSKTAAKPKAPLARKA